jgi:predicted metal-dependent phosphoesterase TrpH
VGKDLLLCELHAHTTWSDGVLDLEEVVDLYGTRGFDVLAVTDHTVRLDDPLPCSVDRWSWPAYATCVRAAAERAAREYGLVVLLGLELTDNCSDPDSSAHALALGLEHFVSVEPGLVPALEEARDQGAAVIAAHPYSTVDPLPLRSTRRIYRERESLAGLIHRYELFNRNETFAWVAQEGLPPIATGDFHSRHHIASWKTLLQCEQDEEAIVDCLRSRARVYLTPFALDERAEQPLAA